MSFDRFFRVALLVVLLAFVAVYFLNGHRSVYGQDMGKNADKFFRQIAQVSSQKKEVGRYQLAAAKGTLYALDTRTGQLYILRDKPMNLKEVAQRTKWQKWYGFTELPRKFGPKGQMGTLKPQ